MKISKSREKYLFQKYFNSNSKKNIPIHLKQFGCRDCDTSDEDLFFVTQFVTRIDRLSLGGSLVTKEGLAYLKKLTNVEYLDLRSMPLDDENLDCILHLQNIEYLDLKFTNVSAEGISTILKSLKNLETLIAAINSQENDNLEIWQREYPDVELIISIEN